MKILFLNYPLFSKEALNQVGLEFLSIGVYPKCDIQICADDFNYDKLKLKIDFTEYDALVYIDSLDRHILFEGLENINIFKIYYGIDSTINFFWQRFYCQLFDITLIDQPQMYLDFLPYSHNLAVMLLFASIDDISSKFIPFKDRIYDITFVGRRNNQTRVKRENILKRIKKLNYKINIIDGITQKVSAEELSAIYQNSKIIINENLFPSLNLRFFEAGVSGSLLFNETFSKSTIEYFVQSKEYVEYDNNNLIDKINYYLANLNKSEEIGCRIKRKITKFHSEMTRLNQLKKLIATSKSAKLSCNLSKVIFLNAKNLLDCKWQNDSNKSSFYTDNIIDINNKEKYLLNYLTYYGFEKDEDELIKLFQNFREIIVQDVRLLKIIYWSVNSLKLKQEVLENLISKIPNLFNYYNSIGNSNIISNSEDFLWGTILKYYNQEEIYFGFTKEDKPKLFFSQFDFFISSFRSGYKKTESLLKHLLLVKQ